MYKQIYRKADGMPELIQDRYDEESEVSIFDYDQDLYTDSMPPSHLYQPIQFSEETNEWIGTAKEEWESNLIQEDREPSQEEIESARTQMELFKAQVAIQELRQENAEIIKEIVGLKGGQV